MRGTAFFPVLTPYPSLIPKFWTRRSASEHISIASHVANESKAHDGRDSAKCSRILQGIYQTIQILIYAYKCW